MEKEALWFEVVGDNEEKRGKIEAAWLLTRSHSRFSLARSRKKKKKKTSSQNSIAFSRFLSSGVEANHLLQLSMRSAVASGRSAAVASSSSAPTAEPLPMRPSSLLLTSRPRTTTTIVAPASAPISGPARGHCAGASRLRRSKVRYYARKQGGKEVKPC